jgi:hypothetical protein
MKTIMLCFALAVASPVAALAATTGAHQTANPPANNTDKTPAYIQNEANVLAPY